jgi:hypothetical protein
MRPIPVKHLQSNGPGLKRAPYATTAYDIRRDDDPALDGERALGRMLVPCEHPREFSRLCGKCGTRHLYVVRCQRYYSCHHCRADMAAACVHLFRPVIESLAETHSAHAIALRVADDGAASRIVRALRRAKGGGLVSMDGRDRSLMRLIVIWPGDESDLLARIARAGKVVEHHRLSRTLTRITPDGARRVVQVPEPGALRAALHCMIPMRAKDSSERAIEPFGALRGRGRLRDVVTELRARRPRAHGLRCRRCNAAL